jgi:hypothetical protein
MLNLNKICGKVYGMHVKFHLYLFVNYASSWINFWCKSFMLNFRITCQMVYGIQGKVLRKHTYVMDQCF